MHPKPGRYAWKSPAGSEAATRPLPAKAHTIPVTVDTRGPTLSMSSPKASGATNASDDASVNTRPNCACEGATTNAQAPVSNGRPLLQSNTSGAERAPWSAPHRLFVACAVRVCGAVALVSKHARRCHARDEVEKPEHSS